MPSKKETLKTKDKSGKELVLDIRFPSGKQLQEAGIIYAATWKDAFDAGVTVKEELEDDLKKKGLWDDSKEKQKLDYIKKIGDLRYQLKKGKMTKKAGQELALKIKTVTNELRRLLEKRASFDTNTAEALAENVRFDYLVSVCTVYNNDGSRFYKSFEDYQERKFDEPAFEVAAKLATMLYSGFDDNYEKNLTENQFLMRFGYMDEKLRQINEDKKLISDDGKLIDEDGNYIDEQGRKVDINGNLIQEEFGEFFDDEPTTSSPAKVLPPKKT